ncbi:MAG: alpha/beta fold hydrolase [Bacteroidota bacterium]
MDPNIQSLYTEVEGRHLHYLTAGSGEGAPLLLLHGWPTSAFLWREILSKVSEKHRVIALDLPGFGKSDKQLDDSFSFRYYSRAIDGFLKNLELEQVSLGVHDLGGPIGVYWMVQNMNKVARLLLCNTLIYPQFSWAVKLFGLATFVPFVKDYLTSAAGIKFAIKLGVHQKEKLNDEIFKNYQWPFPDVQSRKVLLKAAQRLAVKGFEEIEEKLKTFKGPVQILYGEKDKILPDVAKTMARVKEDLPQASITSYPNAGHFLQEEVSPEMSEVILAFMEK